MSKDCEKVFAEIVNGKKYTDQELALFSLGLTEEEVAQVIADDKRIDKGEKLFELTDEQKKASKDARVVHTVDAYGRNRKKEKKSDKVKAGLIELLTEVIKEQPACNSLEILNDEREFEFFWSGKKYKVVLSAPRT